MITVIALLRMIACDRIKVSPVTPVECYLDARKLKVYVVTSTTQSEFQQK